MLYLNVAVCRNLKLMLQRKAGFLKQEACWVKRGFYTANNVSNASYICSYHTMNQKVRLLVALDKKSWD